ncbi:MAG: hypothetical protein AABY07_08735 [Nanoarchaeota archaeon]
MKNITKYHWYFGIIVIVISFMILLYPNTQSSMILWTVIGVPVCIVFLISGFQKTEKELQSNSSVEGNKK